MEGLEKLEEVQRTIHLLHSVGVSEADPISERFLANFTFFLMQPFGELEIDLKCQLISKYASKISNLLLGGALPCGWEGCSQIENAMPLYCDGKRNEDPEQSFYEDVPMVGIDSMLHSNSSLEDFCRSYFIFHKMEVNHPQSIFQYLPLLSFTESYIYQLDGLNEKILQLPGPEGPITDRDFGDNNAIYGTEPVRAFVNDPFRPLHILLGRHGLLTERIREEFRCGEEYWGLERKLCYALVQNKEISIEDVKRAIHLKSFDYRVLNLLLYQLRGEKENKLHMEFLSISELLVEISDDLFDYEDDVVENNFNVFRMFVKFYGASAAPIMLAKFITEAEEKYEKLFKALDPHLSMLYQKRCEEATKEGGKKHGSSLGTWHIPPVIEDETGYRKAFSTSSP